MKITSLMAALGALMSLSCLAQNPSNPYKVMQTAKVGADGEKMKIALKRVKQDT